MFSLQTMATINIIAVAIYMNGALGLILCSTFMVFLFSCIEFSFQYPEIYNNVVENTKMFAASIKNNALLSDQIIISPCKQYYIYKGVARDIAFPVFWTLTEKEGTGPHCCNNCIEYGMYKGVFIMYCKNCADEYEGEAGYGAIYYGVEKGGPDVHKSAWNTYLKHRQIECIGLPEEPDENSDKYTYQIVCDFDQDGEVECWYPERVRIASDSEDDDDDDENSYTEIDAESDTTEAMY